MRNQRRAFNWVTSFVKLRPKLLSRERSWISSRTWTPIEKFTLVSCFVWSYERQCWRQLTFFQLCQIPCTQLRPSVSFVARDQTEDYWMYSIKIGQRNFIHVLVTLYHQTYRIALMSWSFSITYYLHTLFCFSFLYNTTGDKSITLCLTSTILKFRCHVTRCTVGRSIIKLGTFWTKYWLHTELCCLFLPQFSIYTNHAPAQHLPV